MSKLRVKAKIDEVVIAQEKAEGTLNSAPMTTDGKVIKLPGRPIVNGSKRQLELQEKNERRTQYGGTLPKGRPIDTASKKQQREADLAEKKMIGIGGPGWSKNKIVKEVKVGNIKMTPEQYLKYVGEEMVAE